MQDFFTHFDHDKDVMATIPYFLEPIHRSCHFSVHLPLLEYGTLEPREDAKALLSSDGRRKSTQAFYKLVQQQYSKKLFTVLWTRHSIPLCLSRKMKLGMP